MANQTYVAIITKNKARFSTGKTFTRRQLCKMFRVKNIVHEGEFAEVQRSNLRLVGVQAEINTILKDSGLRLQSENYYSKFYVVSKEETAKAVLRQQEKAEAHKYYGDNLEANAIARIKAGIWGTYDPSVISRVIGKVPGTSKTYERKKARIRRW